MNRGTASREKVEAAGTVYKKRFGGEVMYLENAPLAVSSTQIRQMCAAGQDISKLVPSPVAAYITENGLYKL